MTLSLAIKQEVQKQNFSTEGKEGMEFLELDQRKGDQIYHKGPPERVYCKLPNGSSMRVSLINTGMFSNEIRQSPHLFRVKVTAPYYRLPRDQQDAPIYGEVVRAENRDGVKDPQATISNPLLGHLESSQIVKTIEIGDSTLIIGDKGDLQMMSTDGEILKSWTSNAEVARKPQSTTVMLGSDRAVLFKKNFLAEILPKAFFPPFNFANWGVNSDILERGADLFEAALDLAKSLKKV